MSLSVKYQEFINEYFKNRFNGTKAYRHVFPDASYDTASVNASKLLRTAKVAAEIKRRMELRTMRADEVLVLLTEQAKSNIADFLVDDGEGDIQIKLLDKNGKIKGKSRLIRKLTQTKRKITSENAVIDEVKLSLEMYSAQAAAKLIGDHYGLFDSKDNDDDEDDISATWWEAAGNE
jgi:phage terminase small subunit